MPQTITETALAETTATTAAAALSLLRGGGANGEFLADEILSTQKLMLTSSLHRSVMQPCGCCDAALCGCGCGNEIRG